MDKKEIEGAKQLIEIPDVKAGSYSFIGDSDVTYADIRILLDYIKDLEQENQKYKEVIDKSIEYISELDDNTDDTTCYDIDKVEKERLLQILDIDKGE